MMVLPVSNDMPLVQHVSQTLKDGLLRCHVPGHAGQWLGEATPLLSDGWFHADLTELEGLDVLSEPDGCLSAAQAAYANACGVSHTFFLTQGSTTGLQAAMLACGLTEAHTVIVPRNAHRSVVGGLVFTGATPHWVTPDWQLDWGIWLGLHARNLPATPSPNTKAVIVTSPTYEGMASDLPAIAAYCQHHRLYLLVDEAHGAMWPFCPGLPVSACHIPGVDAVVQSCHKTLGSLTQTAVLHVPVGSKLAVESLQQGINLLHTSSPSYPLMLSMDAIRQHWQQHPDQLTGWLQQVDDLRHTLAAMPHVTLWPSDDPSRLVIQLQPFSHSNLWAVWLEAYHGIPYEALTVHAAVYVWGVGLTRQDATRFITAVQALADWQPDTRSPDVALAWNHDWSIDPAMTPRQAFLSPGITVPKTASVGCVARQTVVHCPPGIPIISHGERIHPHHLPFLPDTVRVVSQNAALVAG